MADLQPGSLPTTFTAGEDTDYLLVSRGAQTGRMLRSELLASSYLPIVNAATTIAADGVTDDTAALLALMDALPNVGGTILLPAGTILVNDLLIPAKPITLQGVARGGIVGNDGTILRCTNGHTVIKSVGTSDYADRRYYLTLRNLMVYGSSTPGFPALDLRYVSYFRAHSVNFNNSASQLCYLHNVWDSRFYDCDFSYGGNASGTEPAVHIHGTGGESSSNEIYFDNCRWERCQGTSFGITGSNVFCTRVTNFKMESDTTSAPIFKATGAVDLTLAKGIITATAATGTIAAMVDLKTCAAVDVDFTAQMIGSGTGATITNYIKTAAGGSRQRFVLRTLDPAPEPTAGYMISWDGANPGSFSADVYTPLTAKPYNYYFGSMMEPRDRSGTAVTVAVADATLAIPNYVSFFGVLTANAAPITSLTIPLPAAGGPLTLYFGQAVSGVVWTGGTVRGDPKIFAADTAVTLFKPATGTIWYAVKSS